MKLLLLVLLIAVIAVNGLSTEKIRNEPQDYEDDKGHIEFELLNGLNKTTQPSGDCENNGGACKQNKQCNGTISIDYTCSKNGVCCIDEGKVKSNNELMLQVLSNAILLQGIAIQTLKEDQEKLFKNLNTTISNVANTIQINQNSLMTNLSDGFLNVKKMHDRIMRRLTHQEGFEEFNGRLVRVTKRSDSRGSYQASIDRCTSMGGARPFIPYSQEDFDFIVQVNKDLETGGQQGDIWVPFSDIQTEGQLKWTDNTTASGAAGLTWCNGQEYHLNSEQNDCGLIYRVCPNTVQMVKCSHTPFPMICEI